MYVEVTKIDEIVSGGMKAYEVKGKEIVLCSYDGKIFAISRRCGHMNAPLDLGTLEGYILTCPMHHVQLDITSGEALSGPVPPNLGDEVMPEGIGKYMQHVGMLMSHIRTCDIKTYPVKIDGETIKVEVE